METPTTASITPEQRFVVTLDEFLTFQEELFQELSTEGITDPSKGLTSIRPEAVSIAKALVLKYNPDKIITAFCWCHEDWHMIKDHNTSFIGTMQTKFQDNGIPFDISILCIPFIAYDVIKSSKEWGDSPEEDLPVNKEDLEGIWSFIKSMVGITCSYIEQKRQADSTYMPEIDLEKYKMMFCPGP